jgi:hypothetical protein
MLFPIKIFLLFFPTIPLEIRKASCVKSLLWGQEENLLDIPIRSNVNTQIAHELQNRMVQCMC